MSSRHLEYTLVNNNLKTGKDPFMARIVNRNTYTWEQLLKRVEYESNYKPAQVKGVILVLQDTINNVLKEGSGAVTPLGEFHPSIQGTFKDREERFNPKKKDNHKIKLLISPNKKMEKELKNSLRVKRTRRKPSRSPRISAVNNLTPGRSELFCPGDLMQVRGTHLFFDKDNKYEGIYFYNTNGIPFRAEIYHGEYKGQLLLQCPDIPKGIYNVEILCLRGSYGPIINRWQQPIEVGSVETSETNNDTVETFSATVETYS